MENEKEVGGRLVMMSGRGAAGEVVVCAVFLFFEEEDEGMVVSGQR